MNANDKHLTIPANLTNEQFHMLRAVETVCDEGDGWARASEVRRMLGKRRLLARSAGTQRVALRLREYADAGLLEHVVREPSRIHSYRLPPCKHCGHGHIAVPEDLCAPARAEYEQARVLGEELGLTS